MRWTDDDEQRAVEMRRQGTSEPSRHGSIIPEAEATQYPVLDLTQEE